MNIAHPSAPASLFTTIKEILHLSDDVERVTLTLSAAGTAKINVERNPSYADMEALTKAIKGEHGTNNAG